MRMGTGHSYRMLTLANKLVERGHSVFFVVRQLNGNLIEIIRENFDVVLLTKPLDKYTTNEHCPHADWLEVSYQNEINQSYTAISDKLANYNSDVLDCLIVDHYSIDSRWHSTLKPLTKTIMQVDDLADRMLDVDIVLDQNYSILGDTRYDPVTKGKVTKLCGPKFALLRDEFAVARNKLQPYMTRMEQHQVVLFFGGIDATNETTKALHGLLSVDTQDHFCVIIGKNNPNKKQIIELVEQYKNRCSVHIQVKNMTDFLSSAYLFVGAVGATTWERCALSLPAIVCSVAENQEQVARDLSEINGHNYMGPNQHLSSMDYAEAYKSLTDAPHSLYKQALCCERLVDGKGALRVVQHLEEISK